MDSERDNLIIVLVMRERIYTASVAGVSGEGVGRKKTRVPLLRSALHPSPSPVQRCYTGYIYILSTPRFSKP